VTGGIFARRSIPWLRAHRSRLLRMLLEPPPEGGSVAYERYQRQVNRYLVELDAELERRAPPAEGCKDC
jgi:hypothetical protein